VDSSPAGYPRLATFLDSGSSFLMFRRFGYLQTRLLLEKQSLLAELEDELDKADMALSVDGDDRGLRSAEYRRKRPSRLLERGYREQSEILKDIETTFHEYCKLYHMLLCSTDILRVI
jgi:hypothetical protein